MNDDLTPFDDTEVVATDSQSVMFMNSLENAFIRNFIYRMSLKEIKHEIIKLNSLWGMSGFQNCYLRQPKINYNSETGLYSFDDDYVFASIHYGKERYEMTLKTVLIRDYVSDKTIERHDLYISGVSSKADKSKEVGKVLLSAAVNNSYLKNKVIKYEFAQGDILNDIKIVEIPVNKLNDLFIPDQKKEQIKRFNFALNNFKKKKLSLRYLFNGKPGTGKTQLINSIINGTKGNVTVLFCAGGKFPVSQVFKFTEYFNPCLLIIDDLDFLARSREDAPNQSELGSFLQALDGFLPNNTFLLAATNDKNLVDYAASRPGRFDMILDIGEIESQNYLSLIKRETNNPQILSFFDDLVLNELSTKKVTGAFIVTLVKQLESAMQMKGELTISDFREYFTLSHKGFYSYNDNTYNKSMGFY